MSEDMSPREAGIRAGYVHTRGDQACCPYPLWQGEGPDKVRHPDRDEWFHGFHTGCALGAHHRSELEVYAKSERRGKHV